MSLKELQQFIEEFQREPDPYWESILKSDIRSIIPKHEVCKIQIAKTNLEKVRLIMQNLNSFISLEIHKKNLKAQMIDLNENITQELKNICVENQQSQHIYDFNLVQKRQQIETLCKEMARTKNSSQLQSLLKKNKKWQNYVERHLKQLNKTTQEGKFEEFRNFIQTTDQKNLAGILKSGQNMHLECSGKMRDKIMKQGKYIKLLEQKLKQKILIEKLVDSIFPSQGHQQSLLDEDKAWDPLIQQIKIQHNL